MIFQTKAHHCFLNPEVFPPRTRKAHPLHTPSEGGNDETVSANEAASGKKHLDASDKTFRRFDQNS